ncbi:MAG: hypothetical protein JNL67_20410 [Planctomycetaceae bacterium]|nr:hypothetical protein [Planctomycetaceae bacterium]
MSRLKCRLIVDPPAAGCWNMAVDQALLELAQVPVLRLYRWATPTLTLGYFQSLRDRRQHESSLDCPVWRRSTGGGAIVHDQELTYSLILPANEVHGSSADYYERVHGVAASILSERGQMALLHPVRPGFDGSESGDMPAESATKHRTGKSASEPFLCFQRRASGDLILWVPSETGPSGTGHKILGSAQRKRDGAILQHGSILLRRSEQAPELSGINDFLSPERRWDFAEFGEQFADRVLASFGWTKQPSQLSDAEAELAQRFQRERFSKADWTGMR